jgi:hypothetical protein
MVKILNQNIIDKNNDVSKCNGNQICTWKSCLEEEKENVNYPKKRLKQLKSKG